MSHKVGCTASYGVGAADSSRVVEGFRLGHAYSGDEVRKYSNINCKNLSWLQSFAGHTPFLPEEEEFLNSHESSGLEVEDHEEPPPPLPHHERLRPLLLAMSSSSKEPVGPRNSMLSTLEDLQLAVSEYLISHTVKDMSLMITFQRSHATTGTPESDEINWSRYISICQV